MRLGLFGYAGAGKTTIFNLLTGLRAVTGAGTKKTANLGVTQVPDERVDFLSGIYKPKKTTYAEIHFADMPGKAPTKTTSGLSPQVVGDLRTMDVLCLVLRGFANPALELEPDPLRDYAAMDAELILADLQVVENRVERLAKDHSSPRELEALQLCLAHLENEQPLRSLDLRDDQWALLKGFRFLSEKNLLALVNTSEDDPMPELPELAERLTRDGVPLIKLCASLETEILELDPEDRAVFLADLGVERAGRERFIQQAYTELSLISFLTIGEDECRAWTITRGTIAHHAAGRVHSDIERGFIRAEVIAFEDFKIHGSEAKAKAAGRYRLEGKDYVVQDGDIINYRFNV
ncbi:MAG: DUF933 domain-containing protein [bacterium]